MYMVLAGKKNYNEALPEIPELLLWVHYLITTSTLGRGGLRAKLSSGTPPLGAPYGELSQITPPHPHCRENRKGEYRNLFSFSRIHAEFLSFSRRYVI